MQYLGVRFLWKKRYEEMYGSMLLALWGGWVGVKFPEKKCYITLEKFSPTFWND